MPTYSHKVVVVIIIVFGKRGSCSVEKLILYKEMLSMTAFVCHDKLQGMFF